LNPHAVPHPYQFFGPSRADNLNRLIDANTDPNKHGNPHSNKLANPHTEQPASSHSHQHANSRSNKPANPRSSAARGHSEEHTTSAGPDESPGERRSGTTAAGHDHLAPAGRQPAERPYAEPDAEPNHRQRGQPVPVPASAADHRHPKPRQ